MLRRILAVLLVASSLGGCAVPRLPTPDGILVALGFPKRGFATDAVFPDDAAPTATVAGPACTADSCSQAAQFCMARGYRQNTDGFGRCVVSVEQNQLKP